MTAQLLLGDDPSLNPAGFTLNPAGFTQLEFDLPQTKPSRPTTPSIIKPAGVASSNKGEAGELFFEGNCSAWGLTLLKARRGQIGPDYHVNGWDVQVKATGSIQRDGRMHFKAGSKKRFADYRGLIDVFAFVYVGFERDYYGCMLLMAADAVFRRWRGATAYIRPLELPRTPNLRILEQPRE